MIEKKTPNKFFISKNLLFTEVPNKEMAENDEKVNIQL